MKRLETTSHDSLITPSCRRATPYPDPSLPPVAPLAGFPVLAAFGDPGFPHAVRVQTQNRPEASVGPVRSALRPNGFVKRMNRTYINTRRPCRRFNARTGISFYRTVRTFQVFVESQRVAG